jgi:hypothetical protein
MPNPVGVRPAINCASATARVLTKRSAHKVTGLEVSHLRKSYGRTVAVDDLSFRVEAG